MLWPWGRSRILCTRCNPSLGSGIGGMNPALLCSQTAVNIVAGMNSDVKPSKIKNVSMLLFDILAELRTTCDMAYLLMCEFENDYLLSIRRVSRQMCRKAI
jgi:hypothetical protein